MPRFIVFYTETRKGYCVIEALSPRQAERRFHRNSHTRRLTEVETAIDLIERTDKTR